MTQQIEPLTGDDFRHAEKQRAWVKGHYAPEATNKYDTVDGKITLIQTIIDNGWIGSTETWKLQALGISFGDAVAQELGLIWVSVEDEFGRDPALKLENTTIIVFPLTAISKRVERGEAINVRNLFEDFCRTMNEMRLAGA